jgi:hypothetical protein
MLRTPNGRNTRYSKPTPNVGKKNGKYGGLRVRFSSKLIGGVFSMQNTLLPFLRIVFFFGFSHSSIEYLRLPHCTPLSNKYVAIYLIPLPLHKLAHIPLPASSTRRKFP